MTGHILNLFPLTGLDALRCPYRLLELDGLQTDVAATDLPHHLALAVAHKTHKPACLHRSDGKVYLATTEIDGTIQQRWELGRSVVVLKPVSDTHLLNYSNISHEQIDVALGFLDFGIRSVFENNKSLWKDITGVFHLKKPEPVIGSQSLESFQGFSHRLHFSDGGVYVSLRLSERLLDRRSLFELLEGGENPDTFSAEPFVYRFGYAWYPVILKGVLANSVSTQTFTHRGEGREYSVYDYTLRNFRRSHYPGRLNPDSIAVLYQYPGAGGEFYGDAALCFKSYERGELSAWLGPRPAKSQLNISELTGRFVDSYLRKIPFSRDAFFSVSSSMLNEQKLLLMRSRPG
jgi:hypothetical protein